MRIIGAEHEVEMPLAGKPRWWTVEIDNPVRVMELVRVDHRAINPELHLLYVFLMPGTYTWPPLVAPAMKLGNQAFEDIKTKGGRIIHGPTKLGRELELRLCGRRQ
jgi:hypothetical protein